MRAKWYSDTSLQWLFIAFTWKVLFPALHLKENGLYLQFDIGSGMQLMWFPAVHHDSTLTADGAALVGTS